MSYAHTITVDLPFAAAVQATRDALGAQGFGIIADIDIRGAFADKLGPDAADHRILGACNPRLAQYREQLRTLDEQQADLWTVAVGQDQLVLTTGANRGPLVVV